MAKLKFKDENDEFIPVVQDVKVNGTSVFDGKDANITIQEPDVTKQYVDGQISELDSEKQDNLVSGENIKTVNGQSLLGSGNIIAGTETAVLPYDLVYFDPKDGGDAQFIELIGGLDNLEKIKAAIRNSTPIIVSYSTPLDFFSVVGGYLNESGEDANYYFNMTINFWQKQEETFYTFAISGNRTSNFTLDVSNMPSLLGQIRVYQRWGLDSLHVPEGTAAYVLGESVAAAKAFEYYEIGELIDTVNPQNYPVTDYSIQNIDPAQLTSEVIMEQGEDTIIVSYRSDPIYSEYNVYDWNVIKRSMGNVVSNQHFIYAHGSYQSIQNGWTLYDELTGSISYIDFYEDLDLFRMYGCRKVSVVVPMYPQYNVQSFIECAITYRRGLYRYKYQIDQYGADTLDWWMEYPNTQPDFYVQDESSPAFIKNKPKIWLPELPNDAANKTYVLKSVNGTLEWIEETPI